MTRASRAAAIGRPKKPELIETIQILGNEKTSDDVILRRLLLAVKQPHQ